MKTSTERKRGCGFRKPGALYLVTEPFEPVGCGKLPFELCLCPTCGHGIRFSRGFQWINPERLLEDADCDDAFDCRDGCCLNGDAGGGALPVGNKAGLIWIGEMFYPTPQHWLDEAKTMGISRRIAFVPREFELGTHWIFAAHTKAIARQCPEEQCEHGKVKTSNGYAICAKCKGFARVWDRGLFFVWKPEAIEYVVKGDETKEELSKLETRGISLVKVIPVDDAGKRLPFEKAYGDGSDTE